MKKLVTSDVFAKLEDGGNVGVRKFVAAKVAGSDEPGLLKFTISTSSVDRQGDTVSVDGWRFDNYRKNPVVLWCHDYYSPPLGRAESIGIENGQVVSLARFAIELDPFINLVYELYKGGYMHAVSVGFDPVRWAWVEDEDTGRRGVDFFEQELLEYSCVPVPANPEALIMARSVGRIDTRPMKRWAEERLDSMRSTDRFYKIADGVLVPRSMLESLVKTSDDSEASIGPIPTITEEDVVAEVPAPAPAEQEESDAPAENEESPAPAPAEDAPAEEVVEDAAPAEQDEGPAPEVELTASPVAEKSTPAPAEWLKSFRHHKGEDDSGAVVWNAVKGCMERCLRGEGDSEMYAHLAAHYRDDFDTEPPEQRFVEAAVLRNMPEMFEFDSEAGVLLCLSPVAQATRKIESAIAAVKSTFDSEEFKGMPGFEGVRNATDALATAVKNVMSKVEMNGDDVSEDELRDFIRTEGMEILASTLKAHISAMKGRV